MWPCWASNVFCEEWHPVGHDTSGSPPELSDFHGPALEVDGIEPWCSKLADSRGLDFFCGLGERMARRTSGS